VGDTSDIKAGDTVPAESDGAAGHGWWARSWIGRHWRGEVPLDVAFWRNGYLVNLGLGAVASGLDILMSDKYELAVADTLFLVPIVSLFQKWQMAWGVWGHLAAWLYDHINPEGLHRIVAVALFAFTSAVTVWQVVGIWRSAERYHLQLRPQGDPDRRYLGPELAKLLMVWWVLVGCAQFFGMLK
jgi:hypothetical protein